MPVFVSDRTRFARCSVLPELHCVGFWASAGSSGCARTVLATGRTSKPAERRKFIILGRTLLLHHLAGRNSRNGYMTPSGWRASPWVEHADARTTWHLIIVIDCTLSGLRTHRPSLSVSLALTWASACMRACVMWCGGITVVRLGGCRCSTLPH